MASDPRVMCGICGHPIEGQKISVLVSLHGRGLEVWACRDCLDHAIPSALPWLERGWMDAE